MISVVGGVAAPAVEFDGVKTVVAAVADCYRLETQVRSQCLGSYVFFSAKISFMPESESAGALPGTTLAL